MNRLRLFALAGAGLLGLSFGSAQAAGWHRTYCRPARPAPVVACAPAPVVTCAPAPVTNCYPTFRPAYYAQFNCHPRANHWRHCR